MSSSTTLKAVLIGEDRSLSKTMKGASTSVKGVGDDIDKTSKKADGFGGMWGKVGGAVAAGAAVAGVAVVGFGIASVKSASDLNQTLSKSRVIFGESAAEIEAWGSTAYKNLGLSKNQAIGAAASFGDMFLQLGFARDKATDMSTSVVQLAADLGAFNNLPTAEVADMISSAFRGEYDSLQRLIPNINAARVETEALAMTGKKNAKELTAQEKAAATLAIVQKDGAKAAGAFAKESGELAGSQAILLAAFEDVKAEVGTALLPILTDLGRWLVDEGIPAVKDMTKWWNDHKEEIQTTAATIGRVLEVIGKAVAITTKVQVAGWQAAGAAIVWFRDGVVVPVTAKVLGAFSSLARGFATMLRGLSLIPGFGWAAAAADKMENAARKADGLKAAVQRVPNSKQTNFAANTGTAVGSVRALETAIGRVRSKSVTVSVHYVATQTGRFSPGGGYSAGVATGGPVVRGRTYLVGENGPEMFTASSTGHITPARQTAEAISGRGRSGSIGGSSDDRPLLVQLMLDGRVIQESLVRRKRSTGMPLGLA